MLILLLFSVILLNSFLNLVFSYKSSNIKLSFVIYLRLGSVLDRRNMITFCCINYCSSKGRVLWHFFFFRWFYCWICAQIRCLNWSSFSYKNLILNFNFIFIFFLIIIFISFFIIFFLINTSFTLVTIFCCNFDLDLVFFIIVILVFILIFKGSAWFNNL